MNWGTLIRVAITVLLSILRNRYNPAQIRVREIAKIRKASKDQIERIERAAIDDDTATLSALWAELHSN